MDGMKYGMDEEASGIYVRMMRLLEIGARMEHDHCTIQRTRYITLTWVLGLFLWALFGQFTGGILCFFAGFGILAAKGLHMKIMRSKFKTSGVRYLDIGDPNHLVPIIEYGIVKNAHLMEFITDSMDRVKVELDSESPPELVWEDEMIYIPRLDELATGKVAKIKVTAWLAMEEAEGIV